MNARDALLSRLSGVAWPHGPLLEALGLPPEADVLEVGCGDGGLLASLSASGQRGRRVGLDLGSGPAAPGVERVTGDAHALPLADASFDAVLLVRVLAHLAQPGRALLEARRVLRPGGRLIVAAQSPEHLSTVWTLWPSGVPGLRTPDGRAPWTRLDLQRPVRFERLDDLLDLARSYGRALPAVVPLPLDDQLALTVWQSVRSFRNPALDGLAPSVES